MIRTGRWVVSLLYGVTGIVQLATGGAYLAGWKKPPMEGVTVPPEAEALVAPVVGVFSIIAGLIFGLTAWGIFTWRSWARIVAIILAGLNLLALVLMSFKVSLPVGSIVFGIAVILVLIWLFSPGVQAAFAARGKQE
ncbi:MAG: hypothetical protein ACE5HL_03515 [Terriglobia bacterium]